MLGIKQINTEVQTNTKWYSKFNDLHPKSPMRRRYRRPKPWPWGLQRSKGYTHDDWVSYVLSCISPESQSSHSVGEYCSIGVAEFVLMAGVVFLKPEWLSLSEVPSAVLLLYTPSVLLLQACWIREMNGVSSIVHMAMTPPTTLDNHIISYMNPMLDYSESGPLLICILERRTGGYSPLENLVRLVCHCKKISCFSI